MTEINAKSIKTKDVAALYDVMIAAFTNDPSAISSESNPADHSRQIMAQELTKIGYPMAANLTRILDSHEAKLKNSGGQRATPDAVSDTVAALFQKMTGTPLARTGAAASPAPSAAAAASPAPTPSTTAADSADVETAPEKPEIHMEMNTDFTVADDSVNMINSILMAATNGGAKDFRLVLAEMSMKEDGAEKAQASNASVEAVVNKYKAGETDVDEGSIMPLPEFEPSGFADLPTEGGTIEALDNLISQGVKPKITFAEAITRIKNAEATISEAILNDKTLQRALRTSRPKQTRSAAAKIETVDADTIQFADELNAHVEVSDQVASDIFVNSYGASAGILGFEVPTLEFDHAHPDVPQVDETFRFYAPVLCEALHTIAENEIMWLHGDSGCGKSEFWAQVAARLNMPFTRMNLDGHLTRSDIIGVNRMLPTADKANMEMRFVEGILPRAMARPGILLLDEFDLGDPEIMPIFQPVLEGKPLVLLEDGGRIVHPHPMFRIAITGNTIGLGSANQMYNNAFEQSAATRDRISAFVPMPYMTPEIEKEVVLSRVPEADEEFIEKLIQLANRVRDGFRAGEIHQIFSTRAVLYSAKRYARYANHFPNPEQAVDEILRTVILGRMDDASHNVVKGLIDNIFE